jgi:hypothetical protein
MQSPRAPNQFVARPEMQMVGVRENDLRIERHHVIVGEALDRGARANGHERRRLDITVGEPQPAASRAAIGLRHGEREVCWHER